MDQGGKRTLISSVCGFQAQTLVQAFQGQGQDSERWIKSGEEANIKITESNVIRTLSLSIRVEDEIRVS